MPDLIIRGGTTYRVIADQVGSVRRIVEVSTGAVVQELTYSPFGKVLSDSSPGWQPFAYAGGLYDNDTNLVRFGARDYDAETGRWTAKDPSGFGGGSNFFAYAGNDPIDLFDPVGLAAVPGAAGSDASVWDSFIGSIDTSGDGWLAGATNFSAGFGDTITGGFLVDGGLTGALRDVIGGNESVDMCSESYGLGEEAGEEFLMAVAAGPAGKVAGKVSRGTLKRVKRLVKNLSKKADNPGLDQGTFDRLRKLVEKIGGKTRVDADGVRGTGVDPHAHVEGLGSGVEGRHIWLEKGVK